jgi:hypothetical protein
MTVRCVLVAEEVVNRIWHRLCCLEGVSVGKNDSLGRERVA